MSGLKFCCWLVFLLSLPGCQVLTSFGAGLFSPQVSEIASLSTKTEQKSFIYLRGKVSHRAPFLTNGTYQLTDKTGQIWVLTSQPLPEMGDTILLKGELHSEVLSLVDKKEDQIYITEVEKLEQLKDKDKHEPEPLSHQ